MTITYYHYVLLAWEDCSLILQVEDNRYLEIGIKARHFGESTKKAQKQLEGRVEAIEKGVTELKETMTSMMKSMEKLSSDLQENQGGAQSLGGVGKFQLCSSSIFFICVHNTRPHTQQLIKSRVP